MLFGATHIVSAQYQAQVPYISYSDQNQSIVYKWCQGNVLIVTVQGCGLLSQFSPFRYFQHFPLLSKQTLAVEYHVYIWQVSPQLSCRGTCQI